MDLNKRVPAVESTVHCLLLSPLNRKPVLFLRCHYPGARDFRSRDLTLEDEGNQAFHVFLASGARGVFLPQQQPQSLQQQGAVESGFPGALSNCWLVRPGACFRVHTVLFKVE